MRALIIALTIGVFYESSGEVFKFKDNTSINASIYELNINGAILKLNNKIYIHHYPAYHKRVDNGTYEPIPEPPTSVEVNPPGLPVCVPTRISFMHFSSETLKNMYSTMHEQIRKDVYESKLSKYEMENNKKIALAIYKAIYNKNYKLNNNFKTLAWERKVIKEFTGQKKVIWGKYIHERHHFSRR